MSLIWRDQKEWRWSLERILSGYSCAVVKDTNGRSALIKREVPQGGLLRYRVILQKII